MDYYQKWLLERVNELYDRTYNVDPDQIRQFLTLFHEALNAGSISNNVADAVARLRAII